jgi:hypothetical protein
MIQARFGGEGGFAHLRGDFPVNQVVECGSQIAEGGRYEIVSTT